MEDDLDRDEGVEAYRALSTKERVVTLIAIRDGYDLSEIAEMLDLSYGAVYNYVQDFDSLQFIEKTDEGWEITPVGSIVLTQQGVLAEQIRDAKRRHLKEKLKETARDLDTEIPDEDIDELLDDL